MAYYLKQLDDGSTVFRDDNKGITAARYGASGGDLVTTITAATATVTRDQANGLIQISRAAGSTITLPAATGTGLEFRFRVATAVTSNNVIIKVANATDVFEGYSTTSLVAGGNGFQEAVGGTDDTLTMNGTTTGGLKGSYATFKDVAPGFWQVWATLTGSGTFVTAWSATVS